MKPQAYPASLREAEAGSATEASGDEPRVVDHVDLHAKHTISVRIVLAHFLARAKSKWQNDYEMIQYTYENKVAAYLWVMSQTAYPDITAQVKQKWSGNYEIVKYEYKKQVEVYKEL